ncbi:hypothetical protein L1F30_03420 [Simiduia sp. 21SJ11W-1]|uniref:hypothetical protein n=1 Tax=Simiduia sp. 21SJ11W-1 TaxID=2909669 RepID=UPI00209E2CBE|nr:hypothetical protein [Simiduia sp. 21SJ11W-1]UTA48600.1 hypothetical protein L1F30_03420 [Simiduia sp. 21SJ11W-1]
MIWANRKALPAVNSSLAEIALGELPDVDWESEVLAKAEAAAKAQAAALADATPAPGDSAPANPIAEGELPPEAKALQQP